MTEAKDKRSEEQAQSQLASIKELVAALEADRDRLQELRDERDSFEFDPDENAAPDGPGYPNDLEAWAGENPEDAEELKALEAAVTIEGEELDRDQVRERIEEDPLSVEVRSDWHSPGATDESSKPAEYTILLCTGGPACRIIGGLGDHGEPESARIEHQDWFTPWVDYPLTRDDEAAVLAYAQCFYYGE